MSDAFTAGILSDRAIVDAVSRGWILIDPFDVAHVNPASYDLTLGEKVAVYSSWVEDESNPMNALAMSSPTDGRHVFSVSAEIFDVKQAPVTKEYVIGEEGWVLKPGILYLMHTRETIAPINYVACVDGKSSLGRLGIIAHHTAGYVDPGFVGNVTLEVTVVHPLRVYAGMRFCQVRFHTTFGLSSGYRGNYVGEHARGPVASRAWRQFQGGK